VLVFAFFAPAFAVGFVHAAAVSAVVAVSAAVAASTVPDAVAAHVAVAALAAVEYRIAKRYAPAMSRLAGAVHFCFRHDGQNALHNL
jgi:N-acetylglucosamine kinase-like BadF-type ATPase